MSSLIYERSGNISLSFRYGGRQFHKSLGTKEEEEANAIKGRIDLTLRDLRLNRIELPPGGDLW